MNHDCHRLVFCVTHGTMVAVAETARGRGKGRHAGVLARSVLMVALAGPGAALAELPVPSAGGGTPAFVTHGQAAYQVNGAQAQINQVGNTAILNWRSFNVSPGASVQFRQVDNLSRNEAVQGASFTTLNRIWDSQPSVIAGALGQAAGQKANVILVNGNGIAFMGGAQVNLNSFTASSLDIKDSYILSTLFPGDGIAQFQGDTGFIKVFEGARISAGNFGRVMLLAPTVVNQGKVEAPDGQVIAAAATKVYLRAAGGEDANVRGLLVEIDSAAALNDRNTANAGVSNGRLDGQAVVLTDTALDKLGHVSNLGELTAARGNVSMVGYAVNQMGIASATTSVVSNGSVYLQASDRAFGGAGALNPGGAQRGGQVVLGAASVTSVLPEAKDTTGAVDGSAGAGLEQRSQVQVLGQDIRMAGGARIVAPSGEVTMTAVDIPGSLKSTDSLFHGNTAASAAARVHVASGAVIDVAGLDQVPVSAARNSVQVELRGDELKDSPVNQSGALRGQTAYVDINRALANSDGGAATLIARDSLLAYQARAERTVAERSTAGGSVRLYSQGNLLLESGTRIDLSGGSLVYTPALVNTTRLTSGGRLTDLADADASTRYDGIGTRYTIDYGRWNRREVVDLGQSLRYDPGYLEGKAAGSLDVFGLSATFLQADVLGRTTQGLLQLASGAGPAGARLTVGYDDPSGRNAVSNLALPTRDYKINQNVELARASAVLPQGFGFGDNLSGALADTLTLDAALLDRDRVASLAVFSNQAVTVRDALRAPSAGRFSVIASAVQVEADIRAAGGTIDLAARNTVATVPAALSGALPDPRVQLAGGVQLSVRGDWINERPGIAPAIQPPATIRGGTINLSAQSQADGINLVARGVVAMGQGSSLDAGGGARSAANGTISAGAGGSIGISGYSITGLADNLSALAIGPGGSLALGSHEIRIAHDLLAPAQGLLQLDPAFFSQGGFASYQLTAMDTLTVADGTRLAPRVDSRELDAGYRFAGSGVRLEDFSHSVVRDDRSRQATDLRLIAQQTDVGTGSIVLGRGAHIDADAGASVTLRAREKIELQGSIIAPGGQITARLDRSGGQVTGAANVNPIWLGADAVLDTSGRALTYTDSRGLPQGRVLDGGSVTLDSRTGHVVTQAGSRIDVSGAAPVWLGVPNASGGLGRLIGSDAGSISVFADQGALLDGGLSARGGSTEQRGGNLALTLGQYVEPVLGSPPQPDTTMSLAAVVAPRATGLTPASVIPSADVVRMRVGTDALERAGFDTLRFASRDAIVLEDGLQLGAGRDVPLRDVQLDAARLQTRGGSMSVTAETLRVGNQVAGRAPGQAGGVPLPGSGVLTLQARQLELAGDLRLEGMAQARLIGAASIVLAGVSDGVGRPAGSLLASADLLLQAPVVGPATFADYLIRADGHRVQFARAGESPDQPLSALGSLRVSARDIEQAGRLWAPFGQIDLQASNQLLLADGSLTSVAAAAGTLTPFGKVLNSRSWVFDLDSANVPNGQLVQADLPGKSIRASGSSVTMASGARVDLSGGGDLQAYEFTVGPGGSRDILADQNTYAVIPGFRGGVAPVDAQEARGFDAATGAAVYLSGVARIDGGPGLPDGVYTLLPAHYALLPGAFAVRLDTGVRDLVPGAAVVRQDGVALAAGYLTDSRARAPVAAQWRGIEVLSRAQVLARSEFTLSRASTFFTGSVNRPQDAGLLSVLASAAGNQALTLDAQFALGAAPGGLGAAVDIGAPELVIASAPVPGLGASVTVLDPDTLSALGARSLLIGASRSRNANATVLDVSTQNLTLANDAQHALRASEVLLAAKGTLSLRSGSLIDAQGPEGDAGLYTTEGNGALVRAAATTARFERTGSPDRSAGSLVAQSGSAVRAASSITIDATRDTHFAGSTQFNRKGVAVAGDLSVGATRVNLGAAPVSAEGITYDQAVLDGLDDLARLSLTSYSSFDLYGAVTLGGLDPASGTPLLQELSLRGAGLVGIDNAGQQARVRAQSIALSNPLGAAFVAGAAPGSGSLLLQAERLTLGAGAKSVRGFDLVTLQATELVGQGSGRTDLAGAADLLLGRIRGEAGSDQVLTSTGAMAIGTGQPATTDPAPVTALGARWQFEAGRLAFDSAAILPSGSLQLLARQGDLQLGAQARVDVAGRLLPFFDAAQASWGGTVALTSMGGRVDLAAGAQIDVSGAAGGDAGAVRIVAADGTVSLAEGSLLGRQVADAAGHTGKAAVAEIDSHGMGGFSALNAVLDSGGFDGERSWRARTGDITVAQSDRVQAAKVSISADAGRIVVAGTLDASGERGGEVALFARDDVRLLAGARIEAQAEGAGQHGGAVTLATRAGSLMLDPGSAIAVAAGAGAPGGTVLLRAPRTGAGAGTDVAVGALGSDVIGARSVAVEAVKVYDGKTTLTATGGSIGATLSLQSVNSDNTAFAARNTSITSRLGQSANAAFHILPGVEVRSSANLALASDWNLINSRPGGEAGVLTLLAGGNLLLSANLSDGFSHATACTTATCSATSPSPAALRAGESWSYRLVSGADSLAADPLAVRPGANHLTLAAGKLVRTGTGNIDLASGGNIVLTDNRSAIYTAGRLADAVAGFTNPSSILRPVFAQDGGDLSLRALGDIVGRPSSQLYSEWLYRQGAINPATDGYAQQTAWWVRFDQFAQGVGALGGGDARIEAGGRIADLSASIPTQGRMAASVPDAQALVRTGGGNLSVSAGGDLLGGSYFADAGTVRLRAGGRLAAGNAPVAPGTAAMAPILALGDAQALVQAGGDLTVSHVLNPNLLVQSAGNLVVGIGVPVPRRSLFSGYSPATSVDLQSLTGSATLEQGFGIASSFAGLLNSAEGRRDGQLDLAYWLPASLFATAWQGDITVGTSTRNLTMSPAALGQLRLLAAADVTINSVLSMSDRDPALVPDAVRPVPVDSGSPQGLLLMPRLLVNPDNPLLADHAPLPVHRDDPDPARLYAVTGDVRGFYDSLAENLGGALNLAKPVRVRAAGDVRDLGVTVQHANPADRSQIDAGRDVAFSGTARRDNVRLWVGGPGSLQVSAGRSIDLGTSAGIVSRGDLDNAALGEPGASLELVAGVGAAGVDDAAAVQRLVQRLTAAAASIEDLWLARWLTGNDTLESSQALAAVQAVGKMPAEALRAQVRNMVFTALRTTGRDANNADSAFAADFERGYAALELLFPGIGDKDADGRFRNYEGSIDLFASRVKTERGGDISFLLPGGPLTVGLSNTPASLVDVGSNVLGIVVAGTGAIRGFARDDMLVNQSRVLTVGGGDVLLWSSEGDIDAGKGKKTASAVPPPLNVVDARGNVTQVLQGAVTGSGIGALSTGSGQAGDVDLVAPRGAVNAGDAGIRAGNLNIAAQVVIGSDNIAVSGTTTGTPVADTSAITASASGATTGGDEVSRATAALSQSLAESAQAAQTLAQAVRPSLIRVEVLGYGER